MTLDLAIQRIAAKAKSAWVKLLPPLSQADLAIFEQEQGVELPADDRAYLLQIANGGADLRRMTSRAWGRFRRITSCQR